MSNPKGTYFREEVSFLQIAALVQNVLKWVWRRKFWWLCAMLVGIVMGWLVAEFRTPKFRALVILAAEEEKSSGYEGLAAQIGLDVGGMGGSTLFQGDGLLRLFTSRQLIDTTLLSNMTAEGVLLADALFKHTKHYQKEEFRNFSFEEGKSGESLFDSALYLLRKEVVSKNLQVNKPDKKVAILEVSAVHSQAPLAALLATALVQEVADFYIRTATSKSRQNLEILKSEYDSVQLALNEQLYRSANAADLNLNPARQSLRVASNKAMIEVEITAKVLGEITKNLKLAEINLRRQTPLIQVIDPVSFPLETVGWKKWQFLATGMVLALLFIAFITRKELHV
ncbi:MAG: hypothetical protein C0424_11990 [Sphingobacteriaceae bacterium]|nr:hypothetical protein [Sphingobacteriaceae bacterium]